MNLFKIVYRDEYLSVRVAPVVEKFFKIVSNGATFTSKWGGEFYYMPKELASEIVNITPALGVYHVGSKLLLGYNQPNISMIRAVGAARNFRKIKLLEEDIDNIAIFFASLYIHKKELEKLYDYITNYVKEFERAKKLETKEVTF